MFFKARFRHRGLNSSESELDSGTRRLYKEIEDDKFTIDIRILNLLSAEESIVRTMSFRQCTASPTFMTC